MLMRCEEWNFGQRGLIASNDAFAHPRYKLADFLRRFARGPLAPGFGNERNIALADFFVNIFDCLLSSVIGPSSFVIAPTRSVKTGKTCGNRWSLGARSLLLAWPNQIS
jgi:hypothetical protein